MNTNQRNSNQQRNPAHPFSLSDILETDVFPFEAEISLGGGRALVLTYRPAPASGKEKVEAFLTSGLTDLGFDPAAALRALRGVPISDSQQEAYREACTALGEEAGEKLGRLLEEADGLAISLLIGDWNLSDPITAEVCAALPAEVKRAITRLSREVELPADRISFLSGSARS